MIWVTTDALGVIAFASKSDLREAYPDRIAEKCHFFFMDGWLAFDRYGTENKNTIKTPDGREIPVLTGFCELGKIVGMRGGVPRERYFHYWQAIKSRCFDAEFNHAPQVE